MQQVLTCSVRPGEGHCGKCRKSVNAENHHSAPHSTSDNRCLHLIFFFFFIRVLYVGVLCPSCTSHCRCFSSLSVSHHCQNTSDPSRPYQPSLGSEALLCVALTLNPVSIHQCLLLAARTGFSTEATGAHDYTLACSCLPGTSSLRTSAAVNYTPGMYCDLWLNRAFKWPYHG